jgi:hypothetical protein
LRRQNGQETAIKATVDWEVTELSRTEASGTLQARSITTQWHADFNLPIKISEPARETVMAYDVNGRLLSSEIIQRGGL